jgi:hypothetical protein
MGIKDSIKEGAGFIEEETGEMLDDNEMAEKGRHLRNKGRVGNGKMPKLTKPGTNK